MTGAFHFRYRYVFATYNLDFAIFVSLFSIEGQGKTLEESDTIYFQHGSPSRSSIMAPSLTKVIKDIRNVTGTETAAAIEI